MENPFEPGFDNQCVEEGPILAAEGRKLAAERDARATAAAVSAAASTAARDAIFNARKAAVKERIDDARAVAREQFSSMTDGELYERLVKRNSELQTSDGKAERVLLEVELRKREQAANLALEMELLAVNDARGSSAREKMQIDFMTTQWVDDVVKFESIEEPPPVGVGATLPKLADSWKLVRLQWERKDCPLVADAPPSYDVARAMFTEVRAGTDLKHFKWMIFEYVAPAGDRAASKLVLDGFAKAVGVGSGLCVDMVRVGATVAGLVYKAGKASKNLLDALGTPAQILRANFDGYGGGSTGKGTLEIVRTFKSLPSDMPNDGHLTNFELVPPGVQQSAGPSAPQGQLMSTREVMKLVPEMVNYETAASDLDVISGDTKLAKAAKVQTPSFSERRSRAAFRDRPLHRIHDSLIAARVPKCKGGQPGEFSRLPGSAWRLGVRRLEPI